MYKLYSKQLKIWIYDSVLNTGRFILTTPIYDIHRYIYLYIVIYIYVYIVVICMYAPNARNIGIWGMADMWSMV